AALPSGGSTGPALLPDSPGPEDLVGTAPTGTVAGTVATGPDDRRRPRLHRPPATAGLQILVAGPAGRLRDRPIDDRPGPGSMATGRPPRHRRQRRHHRELRVPDRGR